MKRPNIPRTQVKLLTLISDLMVEGNIDADLLVNGEVCQGANKLLESPDWASQEKTLLFLKTAIKQCGSFISMGQVSRLLESYRDNDDDDFADYSERLLEDCRDILEMLRSRDEL